MFIEKLYFLTSIEMTQKQHRSKANQNSYKTPTLLTEKHGRPLKVMDDFPGMKDLRRALKNLCLCFSLSDPAWQLLWLSSSSLCGILLATLHLISLQKSTGSGSLQFWGSLLSVWDVNTIGNVGQSVATLSLWERRDQHSKKNTWHRHLTVPLQELTR